MIEHFAHLPQFRLVAEDQFICCCPSHPDVIPSMSGHITGSKTLVHCHAGCSVESICSALGITLADLFEKPRSNGSSIVATYPYTDETGQLLFEVCRLDTKPKSFRARKPNGQWNVNGVCRVIYQLPAVLAADRVFISEGERDCDNLRKLGLTATTNPFGAGKWSKDHAAFFKSHQSVTVLPDNDDVGRRHAQQVAASLLGKTRSLKIVELPNLPEKGDVSDWIDAGGTLEQLETLVAAAPELIPTGKDSHEIMQFTHMADLLAENEEEITWLMDDHLPMGGDSLVVAKPKVGKSTLVRCLALAVARGEDFLGCKTAEGPVFYLALEEKRSEVRRHFQAMGATKDDPIYIFCATSPADGLRQLAEAMKKIRPILVIVDPLFRFVRVKSGEGNDYIAITNALEPLHALARETGAHLMAVHHMGKGDRQGGDAVLGTTALFGSVDTLLIMKRSDRYRTVSSIQRYGIDLAEITLHYDETTRTISAGVTRTEADQAEAETAILEFLTNQTEPVEEGTIHDSVEGRKSVKVKALRHAVKEGKIIRTGAGKKNDTYRYSVSCSLVPNIYREQTKQTNENGVSDSLQSADACSDLFAGSEQVAETREPAFLDEKWEEFEL